MSVLIVEPHNDDAALFCAFPAAAGPDATILTVYRSVNQERLIGVTAAERESESERAARALGCEWQQLPFPDDTDPRAAPHAANLRVTLEQFDGDLSPETVWAPWYQADGHPQHNLVGKVAADVFADRARFYTTYGFPGGPRTIGPTRIQPDREAVLRKLRALACFESQILRGPVRFWMMGLEEYEAAPW